MLDLVLCESFRDCRIVKEPDWAQRNQKKTGEVGEELWTRASEGVCLDRSGSSGEETLEPLNFGTLAGPSAPSVPVTPNKKYVRVTLGPQSTMFP